MCPAPAFQCHMCGAAAESHLANVRHMMTHVRYYRCMKCGQPFLRAQALYEHDAQKHDAEPRGAGVVVVDLTDESGQDEDVDVDVDVGGEATQKAVISIDLTSEEDGGACSSEGRPAPGQAQDAPRPSSPEAAFDQDPDEPFFMFIQKRKAEQAAAAAAATAMDVDAPLDAAAPVAAPVPVAAPAAAPERARPKPCSKCSRPAPASRKKACCCKPVEKPKRRKRKLLFTRPRLSLARTPSAGRAMQLQARLQVEARAPAASPPPPPSPLSPVAADLDLDLDVQRGPQAGRGAAHLQAQAGLKPGPRRQLQVKRRTGRPSKKSQGQAKGNKGQGKGRYSRMSASVSSGAFASAATSALMSSGTAPNASSSTNSPAGATDRQPGWIDGLVKEFSAPTPLGRKCTFCPRVFKSAGTSLTHRHVMGHLQLHRDKTCLICGKVSSDKVSQMTHKLEHMVSTNYEDNLVPND